MLTLIIGKSNSGKSGYAESLLEKMTGVTGKYYIATMKVCDDESMERKNRHVKQREGKGFVTIEQGADIEKAADLMEDGSAALLECMTNLVANEMFEGGISAPEKVVEKVFSETESLCKKLNYLLIVTTDTDAYDEDYDDDTMRYVKALNMINDMLKEHADEVVEVADGVPRVIKEA